MDTDERLRAGLEHNAASFTPDVSIALRRVQRRRRNTIMRRPVIGIAAALVAVVALAALTQRTQERSSTSSPILQTNPGAANPDRRFEATITPDPGARDPDLVGRWSIELVADGTVAIDPPPDSRGTVERPAAILSGHELVTDLFGAGLCSGHLPGRYHWSVAPWGDLDLAALDDTCPARTELLTGPGRTWTASPSTPPTSATD